MTSAQKWRPRLWLVVLVVLGLVLCLPFAGLLMFKFYANQLVQQTEESLLSQASIMSALYADAYAQTTGSPEPEAPAEFAPVFPSLSLGGDAIQPPRPDPSHRTGPPGPAYAAIGEKLSTIARLSQARTLAGYRFLDPSGGVIGGSAEVGLSLHHVPEVQAALGGATVSVARVRVRQEPEPRLYDLSRGTRVRVFVAMPTVVDGEVIGAVYISRTPNHIFRFLSGERSNLARAGLFIVAATTLIGLVFWRFITRPIHALIRQTEAATTRRWTWQPLQHFGTREIENLSNSFQTMTERLHTQQDALRSYTAHVTHELKSPLTSAKGATELLRDTDMPDAQRQRFLDNIARDIDRMEVLLASMRDYSLADQTGRPGQSDPTEVLGDLRAGTPQLIVDVTRNDCKLPIDREALRIILTHLVGNSAQHGATEVTIETAPLGNACRMSVADNGRGISAGNRDKVFTPFFTTRRDDGGTGMGLNIVKSIVENFGGTIELADASGGTAFWLTFAEQQNGRHQ